MSLGLFPAADGFSGSASKTLQGPRLYPHSGSDIAGGLFACPMGSRGDLRAGMGCEVQEEDLALHAF